MSRSPDLHSPPGGRERELRRGFPGSWRRRAKGGRVPGGALRTGGSGGPGWKRSGSPVSPERNIPSPGKSTKERPRGLPSCPASGFPRPTSSLPERYSRGSAFSGDPVADACESDPGLREVRSAMPPPPSGGPRSGERKGRLSRGAGRESAGFAKKSRGPRKPRKAARSPEQGAGARLLRRPLQAGRPEAKDETASRRLRRGRGFA